MKKIFFCFLVAFATSLFATQSNNLKAVADKIYSKKDTFLDTVLQTRSNYASWLKSESDANTSLKFGDWYVSQALERYRKNAITHTNPQVNGIDLKAIYGREPFWRKYNIKDGTLFPLYSTNHRLLNGAVTYVAREITADVDTKFSFSAGGKASHVMDVMLNGKLLKTIKDGKVQVFEVPLKKGKNILSFTVKNLGRMTENAFYFVPYADPAIELTAKLRKDFPIFYNTLTSIRYYFAEAPSLLPYDWFVAKDNSVSHKDVIQGMIENSLFSAGKLEERFKKIKDDTSESASVERIKLLADAFAILCAERELGFCVKNVRAAMEDIKKTYPDYDKDGKLFAELTDWEKRMPTLYKNVVDDVKFNRNTSFAEAHKFKDFATKALVANPLLKQYSKWVMIKRDKGSSRLGLPQNWQGNSTLACNPWSSNNKRQPKVCATYKDELYTFDITKPQEKKLLFKPQKNNIICDLDISFDGEKILYSTLDDKMYFRMDELDTTSGNTKTLTPTMHEKIDYYDGIYLPDNRILFCSTACWVGVPCVAGTDSVANLYVMDPNAGDEKAVDESIRQLTFEQDADWMPVLMENGRTMYTRWEYVDNSHYF
ncbi:MAG: hypothetical protein J6B07_02330, partial [Opitutales bacterium]|nr:hypothetical protein [Opitutales bacterium]